MSQRMTLRDLAEAYGIRLSCRRRAWFDAIQKHHLEVGDPPSPNDAWATGTRDAPAVVQVVQSGQREDHYALHELMHWVFWHPSEGFDRPEVYMFAAELVAAASIGCFEKSLDWCLDSCPGIRLISADCVMLYEVDVRLRSVVMAWSFHAGRELGVLDDDFRLTYRFADWSKAGPHCQKIENRATV